MMLMKLLTMPEKRLKAPEKYRKTLEGGNGSRKSPKLPPKLPGNARMLAPTGNGK
jgi:hypothetical protein